MDVTVGSGSERGKKRRGRKEDFQFPGAV